MILVNAGLYVGLAMCNHSTTSSRQEGYRTFHIKYFTFFSLFFQNKTATHKTVIDLNTKREQQKVLVQTK